MEKYSRRERKAIKKLVDNLIEAGSLNTNDRNYYCKMTFNYGENNIHHAIVKIKKIKAETNHMYDCRDKVYAVAVCDYMYLYEDTIREFINASITIDDRVLSIQHSSKEEYEKTAKEVLERRVKAFKDIKIGELYHDGFQNLVPKYKCIYNGDMYRAFISIAHYKVQEFEEVVEITNYNLDDFYRYANKGDLVTYCEPEEFHKKKLQKLLDYEYK